MLLDCLVSDHVKELRPLNLTYVDVKKAFDSVSHESVGKAARRLGTPPCLLNYIEDSYRNLTTRLRVKGQLSKPIRVGQGVRQGHPMSPVLFNAVIDWSLAALNMHMGAKIGDQIINHLALADDLVLASESDYGMVTLTEQLRAELAKAGLQINPTKSATARIQIDGKAKRWIANPSVNG